MKTRLAKCGPVHQRVWRNTMEKNVPRTIPNTDTTLSRSGIVDVRTHRNNNPKNSKMPKERDYTKLPTCHKENIHTQIAFSHKNHIRGSRTSKS